MIPYGSAVTLVDDPHERLALARILALRNEGLSMRAIGWELLRLGLQPRTGTHWHPKVVMDLCRRSNKLRRFEIRTRQLHVEVRNLLSAPISDTGACRLAKSVKARTSNPSRFSSSTKPACSPTSVVIGIRTTCAQRSDVDVASLPFDRKWR